MRNFWFGFGLGCSFAVTVISLRKKGREKWTTEETKKFYLDGWHG
jgi:hypothetical protein